MQCCADKASRLRCRHCQKGFCSAACTSAHKCKERGNDSKETFFEDDSEEDTELIGIKLTVAGKTHDAHKLMMYSLMSVSLALSWKDAGSDTKEKELAKLARYLKRRKYTEETLNHHLTTMEYLLENNVQGMIGRANSDIGTWARLYATPAITTKGGRKAKQLFRKFQNKISKGPKKEDYVFPSQTEVEGAALKYAQMLLAHVQGTAGDIQESMTDIMMNLAKAKNPADEKQFEKDAAMFAKQHDMLVAALPIGDIDQWIATVDAKALTVGDQVTIAQRTNEQLLGIGDTGPPQ